MSYDYWQASQSGSSKEQALGTSAAVAGSGWLVELTAFNEPVSMVDFSVVVAASARK